MNTEKLYTTKEIAEILGVKVATIHNVYNNKLKGVIIPVFQKKTGHVILYFNYEQCQIIASSLIRRDKYKLMQAVEAVINFKSSLSGACDEFGVYFNELKEAVADYKDIKYFEIESKANYIFFDPERE